jgi:hypothetical protein
MGRCDSHRAPCAVGERTGRPTDGDDLRRESELLLSGHDRSDHTAGGIPPPSGFEIVQTDRLVRVDGDPFVDAAPDADIEAPEPTDDKPKPRRRRRKEAVYSIDDASLPCFIFDLSAERERGIGYMKFEKCLVQWGTVRVDCGHTCVEFPRPFESTLSGVTARWHNPAHADIPFITFDGTLRGFRVFSDGPCMVSYLAVGL